MSRRCGSWWDRHYGGVLKRAGGDGTGNAPWWEYWTAQHITHVTQWAVSHERPLPTPRYRTTDRHPACCAVHWRLKQKKNERVNEWMNEWCIYIALYCVLLYTQSALQSCGGGGLSSQWGTERAKKKEILVLVKAKQHVWEARGPFEQGQIWRTWKTAMMALKP